MGVDLILQVLQLTFQGVLFNLRKRLGGFLRSEVELHAEVHAHEQQSAEHSHHLARTEQWHRTEQTHLRLASLGVVGVGAVVFAFGAFLVSVALFAFGGGKRLGMTHAMIGAHDV